MKLSIVIPVYNEAPNIAAVLARVGAANPNGFEKELIVVDDGSTDGTSRILEQYASHNGCRIIRHPFNRGKGAALKTGFGAAGGDYILIQDADHEYDPADWPALLEPIIQKRAETVFGSRVLKENNVPVNKIYFYGGILVSKIFNALFSTDFTDIATGYKVFPRRLVLPLLDSRSDDFVFDAIELTYLLSRHGRVVEVPIRYRARSRREGKKLNWWHGIRCVMAIGRIKLGIGRN